MDKNPRNNDDGQTPLHCAAWFSHLEVCKLICKNIVDKNPTDDFGETPISLARNRENLDIVSFFENMQNTD